MKFVYRLSSLKVYQLRTQSAIYISVTHAIEASAAWSNPTGGKTAPTYSPMK